MTEAKHTALPWSTDPETENQSVLGPDGFLVADCAIFGFGEIAEQRSNEICTSNAHLIVTAVNERPALLVEVEDLRRVRDAAKALLDAFTEWHRVERRTEWHRVESLVLVEAFQEILQKEKALSEALKQADGAQ